MHSKYMLEAIERVAERLHAESVNESDVHSNRLPTWEELTETDRERWRNEAVLMPHLCDRADGVKGHYAVGRLNPGNYHEYWNTRSNQWAAFSHGVLKIAEARELRDQLKLEVAYERAKRRDYRGYEY